MGVFESICSTRLFSFPFCFNYYANVDQMERVYRSFADTNTLTASQKCVLPNRLRATVIQLGCLQRDSIDVWVLLRDFQLQTFTVHKFADNLKVFASNSGLQIMLVVLMLMLSWLHLGVLCLLHF